MSPGATMTPSKFPSKRNVEDVDRSKLTEPAFTEEDWKDFKRGIDLFNAGKFWHAHEAWEQVWRRHHEDSRLFLQGLILMAAAYHLMIEKKRYTGARRNFEKALPRLRLFEPTFLDLPVTNFTKAIEETRDAILLLEKGGMTEIDDRPVPVVRFLGKKGEG